MSLHRVLVVGSGAMGSQIAMATALGGYAVTCQDVDAAALERAEAMLRTRVASMVAKGRLDQAGADAAFARLTFTTDLDAAAADADLVIEAIVELLDAKRELFGRLDGIVGPNTILASNSSSFVPSRMSSAVSEPGRFCNIHFFNPALVMKCVEIVRTAETTDATVAAAEEYVRRIGKTPVVLDREINGFVANRILNAIRDEATFLLEGGYASVEAIDTICRTALAHPMGPFELQDLTGLDVGYYVRMGRYEESQDPRDLPSRSLTERFEAGHLGRKTGRGWYRYDADGEKVSD